MCEWWGVGNWGKCLDCFDDDVLIMIHTNSNKFINLKLFISAIGSGAPSPNQIIGSSAGSKTD